MTDDQPRKAFLTWRDILAIPATYLTVAGVEYLWNWGIEGEAYVDWGDVLMLTVVVFISMKVGQLVRARNAARSG